MFIYLFIYKYNRLPESTENLLSLTVKAFNAQLRMFIIEWDLLIYTSLSAAGASAVYSVSCMFNCLFCWDSAVLLPLSVLVANWERVQCCSSALEVSVGTYTHTVAGQMRIQRTICPRETLPRPLLVPLPLSFFSFSLFFVKFLFLSSCSHILHPHCFFLYFFFSSIQSTHTLILSCVYTFYYFLLPVCFHPE